MTRRYFDVVSRLPVDNNDHEKPNDQKFVQNDFFTIKQYPPDKNGRRFQAVVDIMPVELTIGKQRAMEPTPEELTLYETALYKSIPEGAASKDALCKLLTEYTFENVLDIGVGEGVHSRVFLDAGKLVTGMINDQPERFPKDLMGKIELIYDNYCTFRFASQFDCIWASHILEHIRNPGLFLDKIWDDLVDGGIFAVTVPLIELNAGGGHLNVFTPGHLVGQVLEAGFDLQDMRLKAYGTNLSIICNKNENILPERNSSMSNTLIKKYNAMPQYLIDGIEEFKHMAPSPWGGHERIPFAQSYKW